jgi:DNA replication protein DnaC
VDAISKIKRAIASSVACRCAAAKADALMAELIAIDLLIIDDFALEPMTREERRDVYQPFVERTARAATKNAAREDAAFARLRVAPKHLRMCGLGRR